LKDCSLSEKELAREVGLIVAKEKKHQDKHGGTLVEVNEVDILNGKAAPDTSRKEDRILSALEKINVNVNEISRSNAQRDKEIEELKEKLARVSLGENSQKAKKFTNKCEECRKNNLFCKHCLKCGATDHKRNACTKND
jgi:hypothetical protein